MQFSEVFKNLGSRCFRLKSSMMSTDSCSMMSTASWQDRVGVDLQFSEFYDVYRFVARQGGLENLQFLCRGIC